MKSALPQKDDILMPETGNVTLYGNRVSADVIKDRSWHLGKSWGVSLREAGGGQNLNLPSFPQGDEHLAYSVWTPVCLRLD